MAMTWWNRFAIGIHGFAFGTPGINRLGVSARSQPWILTRKQSGLLTRIGRTLETINSSKQKQVSNNQQTHIDNVDTVCWVRIPRKVTRLSLFPSLRSMKTRTRVLNLQLARHATSSRRPCAVVQLRLGRIQ